MLEVLKLPSITGGGEYVSPPFMIALPALLTFSVASAIPTNANINWALKWLLSAMPIIEDFSFGHGVHEGIERELLPGIGHDGIFNFPTSLRKLHLRDLNIESSALASSNIDIDTIESITLENCGNNQVDSLKNFCHRYQVHRGDGATAMPSLGVRGDSAFMVRGSASFSADVVEIDE